MKEERGKSGIEERLGLLREASAGLQAPDHLEEKLLAAFRKHGQTAPAPAKSRWWLIAAPFAAAILLALTAALWRENRFDGPERKVIVNRVPIREAARPVDGPARTERVIAEVPSSKSRGDRRGKLRKRLPVVKSPEVTENAAAEFLPLPYAPRLREGDAAQVVRVDLPRESMRSFGIPVAGERLFESVRADVLMGQDGIVRAVRFLQ